MKYRNVVSSLFALLIVCGVINARAEQRLQASQDCGGIPMQIDASFAENDSIKGHEWRCPVYDKKQLTNLREAIPWEALGVSDLPQSGWVVDAGAMFVPQPENSEYRYYFSSSSMFLDRADIYWDVRNIINGLSEPGGHLTDDSIRYLDGPEDFTFDSPDLSLVQMLYKAKSYAEALTLDIGDPVRLAYCSQEGMPPFYWLKFPVYLEGIPLHYRDAIGGFPGQGNDVKLYYSIALNEEGLLSLYAPILSSLEKKGNSEELLSGEKASEALCSIFAEQWLPGVESIRVETMGISYFSYSTTGGYAGGFMTYPVWYFEGYYEMNLKQEEKSKFAVYINAITVKQVY